MNGTMSEITVLALERGDGWAFVRIDGKIHLFCPPYRLLDTLKVAEATVCRAVTEHGFVPCDKTFDNVEAVVKFLKHEIVSAHQEQERALPTDGVGRALLRYAPPAILLGFIDRISEELLPDNMEEAISIIKAILMYSPRIDTATIKRIEQVTEEMMRWLAKS